MARILFAWELGGGLGHLNSFLPVARELAKRGHQIFIAARELHKIQQVVTPHDNFMWFQAPLWLQAVRNPQTSRTYCDLLFHCGFLDPKGLLGLVRGWHALFAAIQPDLLICDHAPVSLLSVRNTPIKRMTLGNGFFHPPAIAPLPSFRYWDEPNPVLDVQSEARVLDTTNIVLKTIGAKSIKHMYELFELDACLLRTRVELDHYPDRIGDQHQYVGAISASDIGVLPVWNDVEGKKIFAYLKDDYAKLNELLALLSIGKENVLAYVSNISPEKIKEYTSDRLTFTTQPVKMHVALKQSDLVLCHAGSGTLSSCLMTGVPSLSLPVFYEQRINGLRVEAMECGLCIQVEQFPLGYEQALKRLLEEKSFSNNASHFSKKYTGSGTDYNMDEIVKACEAVLKKNRA